MGTQAMLTSRRTRTKVRPTSNNSVSEGVLRNLGPEAGERDNQSYLVHMSMVKMVEAELKTEVREDMRAAIITASIRPLRPLGRRRGGNWFEKTQAVPAVWRPQTNALYFILYRRCTQHCTHRSIPLVGQFRSLP